ncbi:hypothetical protein BDV11DRAFT_180356 [Aspergillus similis]
MSPSSPIWCVIAKLIPCLRSSSCEYPASGFANFAFRFRRARSAAVPNARRGTKLSFGSVAYSRFSVCGCAESPRGLVGTLACIGRTQRSCGIV